MVDPKSYELAEHFLEEFGTVTEALTMQLAQAIGAVEQDWIPTPSTIRPTREPKSGPSPAGRPTTSMRFASRPAMCDADEALAGQLSEVEGAGADAQHDCMITHQPERDCRLGWFGPTTRDARPSAIAPTA
jgi:hypothetical protein